MDLLTEHHPDQPGLEMAVTAAILHGVARRTCAPAVRVYTPGSTMAFGRLDVRRPGFNAALHAARRHGRTPIVRLAGGQAAAYDGDCVIVEVIRPVATVVGGLESRFEEMAALLIEAVSAAGVGLELGELPGEYCPGRFSLHLAGGPKVAGVAQRIIQGAGLTTAVLVVQGGDALRATVADVYAALELPVDPAAAGAISDGHSTVTTGAIERSILDLVSERLGAGPTTIAGGVRQHAQALATAAARDLTSLESSANPRT